MNIYEKIQLIKKELLEKNLKKSGQNKFAGYSYYVLADITPAIIELCDKYKVFTKFSYKYEEATLTIINVEKTEEQIEYTSPMEELELKGCNKIQTLGGTETYQRRYLYMSAFDIIENDMFDGTISEITTKEEAEKYVITFGKNAGKTLKQINEENPKYLDWILGNSQDERLVKAVLLITNKDLPKTEESQKEKLELLNKLNILAQITNSDLQAIAKHYEKKSTSDLTIEELKETISILEKKENK